ncbi:hypothetical protein [Nocardia sp. X0981]
MHEERPPLPVRGSIHNQAIALARDLWQDDHQATDISFLKRVAAGIRAIPDYPTPHCRSRDPLRGYAHAHQVMAVHAPHRCPRYEMAAEYAAGVRP